MGQEPLIGQSFNPHPRRDMRGVFVPTIFNLTWPKSSNKSMSVDEQKKELINIFDTSLHNGYNTIFFQVRPNGDALYKSDIEPWSRWLTGTEGAEPLTEWDPLEFAIKEARLRGMELHAWINPYRVKYGSYTVGDNNIINKEPKWVFSDMNNNNLVVLDPGIPEVREYIVSIVEDISCRYDIDGIHFDDYFYPWGGMRKSPNNQDRQTYLDNNPDSLSLGDWRRDNVNKMISDVYDRIQVINTDNNKNIIFGVSPFGIWKSGTPKGIIGSSSYDVLYCDPIEWMKMGKVDYLAPQLYWKIGGNQDYNKLSQWWNDESKKYGVQLYISQRYHGMNDKSWNPHQIQSQINKNREDSMDNTFGQIAYRYNEIGLNDYNINDSLKNTQYKYKSFVNPIENKDTILPNAPVNIRFSKNKLRWDIPHPAIDGDLPIKYVIYMFDNPGEIILNGNDGSKIFDITSSNEIDLNEDLLNTKLFVVTSLDKNNNENGDFGDPLYVRLY